MHREPTAISLVAMATPNMPVRSHRPTSEKVENSIPSDAGCSNVRISAAARPRRSVDQ
jgi:hypothetical protein